ncbi:MAG: hypothetical protein PHU42_02115 [Patescibacteria group bacterium]|nr:hypothetical protein [Patescibacteria group bacterium]
MNMGNGMEGMHSNHDGGNVEKKEWLPKTKIWFAEDDRDIPHLLDDCLGESEDLSVRFFPSGESVLEAIGKDKETPDILFADGDLRNPQKGCSIDGPELVEKLIEMVPDKDRPIICVFSDSDQMCLDMLKAGADMKLTDLDINLRKIDGIISLCGLLLDTKKLHEILEKIKAKRNATKV